MDTWRCGFCSAAPVSIERKPSMSNQYSYMLGDRVAVAVQVPVLSLVML